MIGLLADPEFFDGAFDKGLFYGGGGTLLLEQAIANGAAIIWSLIGTSAILLALKYTIGIRVSDEVEETGLDFALHAETAYH